MNKEINIDYKKFIENSMDIILVVDKYGEILHANKKAVETYGYTYDELLNLSVFDIRKQDTRELTQKQIRVALKKGIEFKTYHYRKDGSKFPVQVRSICSSEETRDIVISVVRDITDIEEISKYASIFATSLNIFEDSIIVLNEEDRISYWNKGAEEKFGFKEEEIIGKSLNILVPKNKYDESDKLLSAVRNGNIIKDYEAIRINRDGKVFDISISASPIYDVDGKFSGIVAIYKDISDKKELVDKLKDKYKQLELLKDEADNANKAKSLFLANMSHELRTPLNGISATVQLLQATSVSAEQSKYIKMLKESNDALLAIINDLLDVSKIESKSFKLNVESFNLKDTVTSIYSNLLIEGNSKGLEVSYYLDQDIDFQVVGDEVRLKQILNNLTSNAIKYTDDGYISLRVKKISSDDNCEKIEFRIKDTGIGIEDSFKDKIFKSFSQGDLSISKKYMGTGLGLSISKQLAALMNGDICFESTVGKGSTFIFTCEFKKIKNEISGGQEKNLIEDKIHIDGSKVAKRILCVEDNLINQEVMENIIKRKGYKYIAAYNGNEALEILKNDKADLILMDIQLPELNGFETTKAIREMESDSGHIPILAMTAYATFDDKEKCILSGMDEYISKPFDVEKLYEIIEFYLGR